MVIYLIIQWSGDELIISKGWLFSAEDGSKCPISVSHQAGHRDVRYNVLSFQHGYFPDSPITIAKIPETTAAYRTVLVKVFPGQTHDLGAFRLVHEIDSSTS